MENRKQQTSGQSGPNASQASAATRASIMRVVSARVRARLRGTGERGSRLGARLARRMGLGLALLVVILTGTLAQFAAAGLGLGAASRGPHPVQGKPNPVDPRFGTQSLIHPWHAPALLNPGQPVAPTPQIGRGLDASGAVDLPMKPGSVALTPDAGAHFAGSDGVLSVSIPAGAVSAADLAAAGGKLTLLVSQVAPASGSSAGGGGHISLGMYLLQLVDASGRRVTHGLRKPITLTLHYGPKGIGADPSAGAFELNLPLPHGAAVAPDPLAGPPVPGDATAEAAGLGAISQQKATVDLGAHTLKATAQMATAQTSLSFNTDSPVANIGGPDPYTVDLSGGGLTATYPLDLPPGPGGLTPPLQLTYSSASVSGQHNPQGAAPWVGEGWNLSLGSISWSEHLVSSGVWESEWALNDAYGTSADLIPPDITVSSYWDDTVNYPCDTGTTGITPTHSCPVQFHTSPETHAKVVMYLNANTAASSWLPDGAGARPPCWRVFLPNGIMEEFGCTQDSLQWYFVPGIGDEIAAWYPDLISDAVGNQIHIGYINEVESKAFSDGTHQYVRDVELANVEYDSPTCVQNATVYADNYCSGTAAPNLWKPLMRVHFHATHNVANTYGSSCATANGTLRCDDPVDISGGLPAPQVQNAWVLDSASVEVWQSGNWQTLRSYNFFYDQAPQWTAPDPVTGEGESVAGHLNLTRIQEVGSDGATALPPVTLHYTYVRDIYEDSSSISPAPAPSAGCGFSWNAPCNLWSESEGGNGYYLDTMDNGLGMEETYAWAAARNNTHGGYNGASNDPFSCNGHESAGYPCDEADDQGWDHIVLTSRSSTVQQDWASGNKPVTSTTAYHYLLTTFSANTQLCSDCTASMYWGSQNDVDYLDFYNGRFMGFAETDVNQPDGSVQKYHYYATTGWGVYDTAQIPCGTNPPRMPNGVPCHASPWWNISVAGHGRAYEQDDYNTNGTSLLSKEVTAYTLTCPPSGVAATPTHSWDGINTGSLDNMNVAMVDLNNPVGACELHTAKVDDYLYDGQASSAHRTDTYTYDTYGRLSTDIANSNSGGAVLGSPTQIETAYQYIWNDAVTQYPHSATGIYIVDRLADAVVEDTSSQPTHYRCDFVAYDGNSSALSGQQSSLVRGEATAQMQYTQCGTYANGYALSGPIKTTMAYDSYSNLVASDDPDATLGDASHVGCTTPSQGNTTFTSCTQVDSTFEMLPTVSANAKQQATSIGYGMTTALGGFGLWPTTVTDPNQQVISTAYDALGRTTSVTLPGETSSETTSSTTYTIWCAQGTNGGTSGAQAPCVEVDTTQRLDSNTTVIGRAFYDGYGRLVETRAPAPGGHDVITYTAYDVMGNPAQQSVAYQVAAYTGTPGAAAFSPFATVNATKQSYDGLGRVISVTDPLSNTTTTIYAIMCGAFNDSACYDQSTTVDPLSHWHKVETDALGRVNYDVAFSGNGTSGSPYTQYALISYSYDYAGDLTKVLEPDGSHTLTYSYDEAGRVAGMIDPDRGTESYTYDANGNLTKSVDARGTSGTVYLGYDGLNRLLWRNTTNSSSGAYVIYSYDTGSYGVGRLSAENFNQGKSLGVGSYTYSYDVRGQTTGLTEMVDGSSYTFSFGYNDAGEPTSVGYSDKTYLCDSYDGASGWLNTVSVTTASAMSGCATSGQTTLASGLTYSGDAGAAGLVTGASLNVSNGALYSYAASYDDDLRLLSSSYSASGSTLYQTTRGYDAASNVTQVDTTLAGGVTDNQSFCYDEQNRLVWASSFSGTGPCGIVNSGGNLTAQGAKYTASYAYDTLDRLTSGPAGSYTYGDSAHLHAATSTTGGETAAYNAAGDMTCRASATGTTCSGSSPTGSALTYDNEGQLTGWQTPYSGTPTATASFAYDGEGSRVAQKTVSTDSSTGTTTTTTTDYLLDGLEEPQTTTQTSGSGGLGGGSFGLTEYYPIPGIGTAVRSGSGGLFYLASDGLGSVSVALDTSGHATAEQLYSPYGTVRYSSGTMPTAHGYTGQIADAMTGLDYYGARYYDPNLGQFASADTVIEGGLDRYAYVGDSPCTYNDPSGHCKKGPSNRTIVDTLSVIAQEVIVITALLNGPKTPAETRRHIDSGWGGHVAITAPAGPTVEAAPPSDTGTFNPPDWANPNSTDSGPGAEGIPGETDDQGSPTGCSGGAAASPEPEPESEQSDTTSTNAGSRTTSTQHQGGGSGSGTQGPGTSSHVSIVPGRGWARWMSYEAEQDWQAQLAQVQDARTARLKQINNKPPYAPKSQVQCVVADSASGTCGGTPLIPWFKDPPIKLPELPPIDALVIWPAHIS